jgi:iron complex outermembrane receptor protein
MNIKNELYYNPIGGPFGFGANENYDKTRHDGFELTLDSKILKNIELFSNYSYTKSVFIYGIYDGKNIPMVPRHKGNLGIRFFLPRDITLNLWADYLGERHFINDQANSFSRLNGYATVNLNLSYKFKDFTISTGINNIFDKEYSEYGVCNNITGAKNYYPNPARNFNLKLDYKF